MFNIKNSFSKAVRKTLDYAMIISGAFVIFSINIFVIKYVQDSVTTGSILSSIGSVFGSVLCTLGVSNVLRRKETTDLDEDIKRLQTTVESLESKIREKDDKMRWMEQFAPKPIEMIPTAEIIFLKEKHKFHDYRTQLTVIDDGKDGFILGHSPFEKKYQSIIYVEGDCEIRFDLKEVKVKKAKERLIIDNDFPITCRFLGSTEANLHQIRKETWYFDKTKEHNRGNSKKVEITEISDLNEYKRYSESHCKDIRSRLETIDSERKALYAPIVENWLKALFSGSNYIIEFDKIEDGTPLVEFVNMHNEEVKKLRAEFKHLF